MRGYTKRFNETKYMSFFIKDDVFLEKKLKNLEKFSNNINKRIQ